MDEQKTKNLEDDRILRLFEATLDFPTCLQSACCDQLAQDYLEELGIDMKEERQRMEGEKGKAEPFDFRHRHYMGPGFVGETPEKNKSFPANQFRNWQYEDDVCN